jgi:hypothetical protein
MAMIPSIPSRTRSKGRHPVQPSELTTGVNGEVDAEHFADALDLASDQDRPTWVTDPDGKRIAALVPPEVLEFYQAATDPTVTPVGRHRVPEPARS